MALYKQYIGPSVFYGFMSAFLDTISAFRRNKIKTNIKQSCGIILNFDKLYYKNRKHDNLLNKFNILLHTYIYEY